MKVWSEIFESLYTEHNKIICKWGESKEYHNDYKIDCRLLLLKKGEKIDISGFEAARYYMYHQKTNDDHLKLCTEGKDILDHSKNNSSNFNSKKFKFAVSSLYTTLLINYSM